MTRSILITGCSSGIGLDAARTLSARGWRVFASCRAEEDCARLRSEGFEAPRLDYEDSTSIDAAISEVLEVTGGRLDALFNNGAYAIPGLVEDLPTDALRAIFEANVFGWHHLTRAAIVPMRRRGEGRIVQCSSVLGFAAAPWRGAYNATKFAIEGLTDTLRREMAGSGLHVSLIEPGPIGTRFRANARQGFERWIDWRSSARRDDYETMMPRLYSDAPDRFERPPAAVTAALVHALESRNPRARYRVTLPTRVAAAMVRALPVRAIDRILASA